MANAPLHDPQADPHAQAAREVRCTTCYMCACRCGIRVHLRDGKVRYIDGNPDHPLNQGVICAKGASGAMKQYSPARLLKPLKRKEGTERGAGEFEEIEWEEAFVTLAERLGKIRATDPKKFALFTGRDQMQALTGLFARQFGMCLWPTRCQVAPLSIWHRHDYKHRPDPAIPPPSQTQT